MKHMTATAICTLLMAMAATADDNPQELGRIRWQRGFDSAATLAQQHKKPLLVLFQEVPGCSTCVNYGRHVLSHPLIIEAAESLFVPVAVYNNIDGQDKKTLIAFNEPAWNNPVVRIMSHDQRELTPRLANDYTVGGLAQAMLKALEKVSPRVPAYVRLLAEEHSRSLEKATFAMHCFWEGEAQLGKINGVVTTLPGFIGDLEVVDVDFDPNQISFEQLLKHARKMDCASKVFTRSDEQTKVAAKYLGDLVQRTDEPTRPDRQPKYYLANSAYKHVPMTRTQLVRVNSALGMKQDPSRFLSPRQISIRDAILSHPDHDWPVADMTDFVAAWDSANAAVNSVAQSQPDSP